MNDMKILLLDPTNAFAETLRTFPCALDDTMIITGEQVDNYSSDSSTIDIIVGGGEFGNGSRVVDQLLTWRTHPYTYLVPCWIATDRAAFTSSCLWPRLAIDHFSPELADQGFCGWLTQVAEWQQTRMHLESYNTLQRHSALEVITSLALRKASGKITVFDEEGGEGYFLFRSGCLAEGQVKHLSGADALLEFMAWLQGSYGWESSEQTAALDEDLPLDLLIADGLRVIRDANLLYHFLPDLQEPLRRTESQSALHDGAAPFFAARKEIYSLIDGTVSTAQLVEASPLSRPRTMSLLAEWFSLGDIAGVVSAGDPRPAEEAVASALVLDAALKEPESVLFDKESLEAALQESVELYPISEEPPAITHRLLIVDDSSLMRRALKDIFSKDPRFEVVGVGRDGLEGLNLVEKLKPDVVTLDIQMPRMDGLTALKHIMIRDSRPVVILSAFTKQTSQVTYESFKYGAVDVCTKPAKGKLQDMEAEQRDLRDRVAQAACVHMEAAQYIRRGKKRGGSQSPATMSSPAAASTSRVVLIGCGAGGFPSLLKLMFAFSWEDPTSATVACMAMPARVVQALLPNLDKDCARKVVELTHGCSLEPGACHIYSSDSCFRLQNVESRIQAELEPECREGLGSLDCLFQVAAQTFGERVTACILSGIGDDGLAGLQAVKERGGRSYVLSPQACLKQELPRRVLELGSAEEVRTVGDMARMLWGLNQV
jgi:two-component system, chemotaxis family, protein-glutamate methylesterase/glutaminase